MLTILSYKIINITNFVRRFFRKNLYIVEVANPYDRKSIKSVTLLASDINKLFKIKEFIGVAWHGGNSDHEKGLALDIIPNCFPFIPKNRQLKTMDAVYNYLIANTDIYTIKYVIWQNMITEYPKWVPKQNINNTSGRSRSELHLDHIHVSVMKDIK